MADTVEPRKAPTGLNANGRKSDLLILAHSNNNKVRRRRKIAKGV